VAFALIAVAAGCAGGAGTTVTHLGPGPEQLASKELKNVQQHLRKLGYSVEAKGANELGDLPPVKRRSGRLSFIQPIGGLQADLPGHARGFVYEFTSHDRALTVARASLPRVAQRGISECGRTIYFAVGRRSAADTWAADVSEAVNRDSTCARAFTLIS
jgi:hypothetical protein